MRQAQTTTTPVRWQSPVASEPEPASDAVPEPAVSVPVAETADVVVLTPEVLPAAETTCASASAPAGETPTPTVRFWTQDESRFGLHTVLRRRVTLKGVKPLAICQQEFANCYLYGAIEPLTGESVFLEFPQLNTTCFQIFLDTLSQNFSASLNVILLDNGSFHHAKKLQIPANIRLVSTPPYTPEANPIERLWEDIKGRLAGLTFATLDELSDKLCEIIRQYKHEQFKSLTGYPFFLEACNAASSP